MGYWNTRGLRGSTFEEYINLTNEYYTQKGLAVVQKVPTPIKPVKIDKDSRTITLGYFEQQSTVDYIGAVQGIPICFDAKETNRTSLVISHIHPHQIEFMRLFEKQDGVSFLLVHMMKYGRYFFLPFSVLDMHYAASKNGGRQSIPYSAFEDRYEIFQSGAAYVHYLKGIQTFLEHQKTP